MSAWAVGVGRRHRVDQPLQERFFMVLRLSELLGRGFTAIVAETFLRVYTQFISAPNVDFPSNIWLTNDDSLRLVGSGWWLWLVRLVPPPVGAFAGRP
jgi:hypothetical protein